LMWLLVREPKAGRLDAVAPAVTGGLASAVKRFFGNPVLWRISLAGGLSSFVTYGLLNWLPSFLMRSKGMELGEVARYLSVTSAGSMALGLWLGGYLADRLGKSSERAYALVPCCALLAALPIFVAAVLYPDWGGALALFAVPIALNIFFMGPSLAIVQNRSAPSERTVSSALFLLINNLVGLGCGPLFVGVVSDVAASRGATDSLQVAMLALAPMFVIGAIAHYFVASAMPAQRRIA
ncbi:MAG: major facilitator superfamily 1, partial [Brevundimonas sp.]|nr:major facilitator superfamily 1 [Brevundimonas sp.]